MKEIEEIVKRGDIEQMHELGEIMEEIIEELDEETAHEYKMELYTMAYGCTLTDAKAHEIVHKMKPFGEKWTMETTTEVKNKYGIDVNDVDFYVVMNSAYNDYHDIFQENVDMYVKFAKDFIQDVDGKEHKVFKYFM